MKRLLVILLLLPVFAEGQIISVFAGTGGGYCCDGGPATAAGIPQPVSGIFDSYGNYYFADCLPGNRIRKIDASGIISTIAGNGVGGYNGDNIPATAAQIYEPVAVKLDALGNIYIDDLSNLRIRKVDIATGIITTVAGTGTSGFAGDNGPATAAMLGGVEDMCFDKWGNLFLADDFNHRVRKVDTSGIITTIAGTGTVGHTGDNGPATAAEIRGTIGLAVDDTGNVYITDSDCVRKISTSGIIATVAGNYIATYIGDGMPATAAQMSPDKLAFDIFGQLYIADVYNLRIYKIDSTGIMRTVAGNGGSGFLTGNGGPATAASIYDPAGLAFDACGNLYIAENYNQLIRKVTYPPILTIPTVTLSGIPSAAVGTLVTVTATVTNTGSSYNIEWFNHNILFNTTTVPYVTYTKTAGTDTITARVISTATYGCYDSTTSSGFVVTVNTEGVSMLSNSKLSIYPNPAYDVLHIDGVGSTSLSFGEGRGEAFRLLSIVGTVLLQGTLKQGSNNIPIQSLPPGMYMIEIISSPSERPGEAGQRIIKKIIKQ